MDQQKEKEQNPMKKDEEDSNSSHSIADKMALVELEENHLHRRLPLELECEIFKCLKLEIQHKFIWGVGRGIYAMFRQRLLRKTIRLSNPKGNKWHPFNKSITVSPDGFNATNNTNERAYVFASKGFAISVEYSRVDNFTGTLLYYYEVKQFGDVRIGLSDSAILDPNDPSSFFFRPNICVLFLPKDYCFYYIATEDHLILPEGAKKYDSSRNVYGCGLVLDPEDKLAIFFTSNGMLIDGKMPISPSVDYLFPAVTLLSPMSSIEANFGDNKDKPFLYDIKNCPGMELDCI